MKIANQLQRNTKWVYESLKYCNYNNHNIKDDYIELQAVQFICDKNYIVPGLDKIEFGIQWYKDWYEPIIYSKIYNSKSQFDICFELLCNNINTRQAILTMTGPQWFYGILNDGLICTNTMQFIYNAERNSLKYIVSMRSNDVARFPSDYAWQQTVYNKMLEKLNNVLGERIWAEPIVWNCNSLHIFNKDWHLLTE